jgi:hypothetical protein
MPRNVPSHKAEWRGMKLLRCPTELFLCPNTLFLCPKEICLCRQELCLCRQELCLCRQELCLCRQELCLCRQELCLCRQELCLCRRELCLCRRELCPCRGDLPNWHDCVLLGGALRISLSHSAFLSGSYWFGRRIGVRRQAIQGQETLQPGSFSNYGSSRLSQRRCQLGAHGLRIIVE